MPTKLVICEKPSVAQSIAAVLNAKKRGDGFFEGGDGWIVSWCFGHLVELAAADDYGDQYKRWSRDALPILPEQWKYTTSKDKAKQLSILRDLMKRKDVDSIVCATDAGREGELIFRLVYDYCKCKKSVQRLWISSMEDSAIRDGFNNLRPGAEYEDLYQKYLADKGGNEQELINWRLDFISTELVPFFDKHCELSKTEADALSELMEIHDVSAGNPSDTAKVRIEYLEAVVENVWRSRAALNGTDTKPLLALPQTGAEVAGDKSGSDGKTSVLNLIKEARTAPKPPPKAKQEHDKKKHGQEL